MSIAQLLASLLQLWMFVVFLYCILSWVPNIRWYEQPFRTLDSVVGAFLAPFRKFIPPIGGIDFSAMIAIFVLQLATNVVVNMLR